MLTRDSRWWWVGMALPIVVEIIHAIDASPTDFGLPAGAMEIIRLVAIVIGIISGKLATSPLKGADKPDPLPFR